MRRSRDERVNDMVAAVARTLRASRAASEAARRLAPEAIEALIDAGILRALVPEVCHGSALGPVNGVRRFEHLARIDSAAAWVFQRHPHNQPARIRVVPPLRIYRQADARPGERLALLLHLKNNPRTGVRDGGRCQAVRSRSSDVPRGEMMRRPCFYRDGT